MSDLTPSTELLNAELPDPRFVDDRYLHWLYEENPYGPAYQENVDEGRQRIAHYALIPQEYRHADGRVAAVFSLNAVTRSGTQRKGYFTKVGLELYGRAGADGRPFVIGVSNAKSIGAVVKYMGWRLVGRLPVRVCPPLGLGGGVEHYRVDPGLLASDEFARLTSDLDDFPARDWTNCWSTEHLRWRLARPHAKYALHVSRELVAISTRDKKFGVPAAVMLKLLPRGGRVGPISPRRVIAAACRFHRAPCAVYAGFNAHVPVRGIRPPRRLLPSPLFLIVRALDGHLDQDAFRLETFEFLDLDGY